VKVLVIVEDFKGWERGADWGKLSGFSTPKAAFVAAAFVATSAGTHRKRHCPVQTFGWTERADNRRSQTQMICMESRMPRPMESSIKG